MNQNRSMTYKFVQLPEVVQKELAKALDLIEDPAELDLNPVSLWQTLLFVRASKRGQLEEFRAAIEKAFKEWKR